MRGRLLTEATQQSREEASVLARTQTAAGAQLGGRRSTTEHLRDSGAGLVELAQSRRREIAPASPAALAHPSSDGPGAAGSSYRERDERSDRLNALWTA